MTRTLVLFCIAMTACGGGDDAPSDPDAAADVPGCITAAKRSEATVNVSGQVVDFSTGEPVEGAEVEVNTAWDIEGNFPDECPALATFTTDSEGRFGPQDVAVGSPTHPPIAIFLVTGDGLAPTSSDQRLNPCTGGDCGFLGHTIATPTQTLATAWREELAAGGMPDAASRGIVLFEFREAGAPTAGVVPRDGDTPADDLTPDVEVRFLEEDRATLTATGTAATTASGVAVIGVDAIDETQATGIAGGRDGASWDVVGVLVADGWFFLEDKLGPS